MEVEGSHTPSEELQGAPVVAGGSLRRVQYGNNVYI